MRYQLLLLAMRVPNSQGIYTLSNSDSVKELSVEEFEKYQGREINVSLDRDGISNPQKMTAYAYGLSGWYLAEFVIECESVMPLEAIKW